MKQSGIVLALAALVVQLSSCTTQRTSMITTFSAPDAAAPIGPYSHGVQCWGKMIFLSGQIPLRADGTMLDGSIEEQTAQVFTNIKTILATRGAALQHVVKTTVFLKDMSDFAAMNSVYAAEMGDHRPARSAVEVSRLPKDARVEIEVIACLP